MPSRTPELGRAGTLSVRTGLTLLLLAAPAAQSAGTIPTATGGARMTTPEGNQVAILKVLDQQQAAMVAGNIPGLNDMLDEHFMAVHITGYRQPRAEWLAQIEEGYFKYHSVQNQSTTVSVNGTAATAVRRARIDVTIGGSRATWRLESTTQLAEKNDQWKITMSRSTTY